QLETVCERSREAGHRRRVSRRRRQCAQDREQLVNGGVAPDRIQVSAATGCSVADSFGDRRSTANFCLQGGERSFALTLLLFRGWFALPMKCVEDIIFLHGI